MAEIREVKLLRVEEIGYLHVLSAIAIFSLMFSLSLPIYELLSFPAKVEGAGIYQQPYFLFVVLYSAAVALIPLAIRTRQILAEINRLSESVIIMYDSLSTYLRAGLNLVEAIETISEKITSRILKHRLKILVSLASQGVDIETALNKISYGLPTRISNGILALLPVSEAGGRSPEIAVLIRDFYEKLLAFERLKRSSLSVYFYIVLLSLVVYEATTMFLIRMYRELYSTQATFFQPVLDLLTFVSYTNAITLIVIFFSSLIISKITRGTIKYMSDYLFILLVIHIVFFVVISRGYLL